LKIRIQKIIKSIDNPLPSYATEHSSGMDVASASVDDIEIEPMQSKLIPTNIIFEIPPGYEGQIRPRSGLAINHNIGILNSPGTIDSDYRGEVKIILTNFGDKPFTVRFGDRIAQMAVTKVEKVSLELTDEVTRTKRNTGGFGHTGK
jgi:dUTP pyrophosphatase